MQPPPPAYTPADAAAAAAAREHIMSECGLHDFMSQAAFNNNLIRPARPLPHPLPRTQSYSSLITPSAAAAHPPAAPPKLEGLTVEESPLSRHRYDMGVMRKSKVYKNGKKVFKNGKQKFDRLCYLLLLTCFVAGIVLVAWGCKHRPQHVRWAVITGTVMLCIFGVWFIGYIVIWDCCGDGDSAENKAKTFNTNRIIRMAMFYCLVVLGTGIGLLVWGSKYKPHKLQGAVIAGAVVLGAHAAFAALLFVCCGCGEDVEQVWRKMEERGVVNRRDAGGDRDCRGG